MPSISSSTSPRPHPDVVARRVGDGGVLVHLTTNGVFELNQTGIRIWELLAAGTVRSGMVDTLMNEYGVDIDTANRDIDVLCEELTAKGLLTP